MERIFWAAAAARNLRTSPHCVPCRIPKKAGGTLLFLLPFFPFFAILCAYENENTPLCQPKKRADLADGAVYGSFGSGPHCVLRFERVRRSILCVEPNRPAHRGYNTVCADRPAERRQAVLQNRHPRVDDGNLFRAVDFRKCDKPARSLALG